MSRARFSRSGPNLRGRGRPPCWARAPTKRQVPPLSPQQGWTNRTSTAVPGVGGHERGGEMLLARVAEAVYWAGRYLERAEDMSRIVQVHGETHVDLPVGADVGWGPLLDICGADASSVERLRRQAATKPGKPRVDESTVVRFVVTDRDNPT